MTLTFGSLFAGIGGIDLGLERAGMRCKWQVELDDYCRRVLAKHWPEVTRHADIRDVGAHNLEPVDVIAGGFPCQPHSLAGKRLASEDERDLWGEYARLIRELRPRWILAENVPGLLSSEAGRFFGRVLRDLAESGYDAEWDCIPAAAVGAPHIRDRVFVVAHTDSPRRRIQQVAGTEQQAEADAYHNGKAEPLADADSKRCTETREHSKRPSQRPVGGSSVLAHSHSSKRSGLRGGTPAQISVFGSGGENVAHTRRDGLEEPRDGRVQGGAAGSIADPSWWAVEPDVGRVAHGVPSRVDRLRALGNAVVPQVAEFVGRRIVSVAGAQGS